jgi:hypothetical protein
VADLVLAGGTVLVLTGCASVAPEAAHPAHPAVASVTGAMPAATTSQDEHVDKASAASADPTRPANLPTCRESSGFALSLASGYHGWDSATQAAHQFSLQAEPAGYGTANTVWTASATDRSGVTLTAPKLALHAVRLPNGRWAIDSGHRCS